MSSPKRKSKASVSGPPLIVGIGASAGGVEALQTLLESLPPESEMSVIVHLHVDPTANDVLSDVVSKFTRLPVVEAENGIRIKAGHIYTVPGHAIVNLKGGVLQLMPAEKPEERRNPIDKLFFALAQDQGERAVAIVLSGNGDDGALGLKEVSRAGGMTLVQAPSTARNDEMPENAIEIGVPDHVLSPANLAEELKAYAAHMQDSGDKEKFETLRAQVESILPEICDILLAETGHNFRHYKISTLSRRVQRRIQVLRTVSVQDYLQYLKKNKVEAERLFDDLLIGVTAFFRDPDAFEMLGAEVLPRILKDKKPEEPVRIWVPGCSSGEEAYTLAMLLVEQMDKMETKPEVQIFATDIDEEALTVARQGSYPLRISSEVREERLKRFFIKKAQHYHVSKEIRGMVLFSLHNLINDPPFSRLDMISCRNLLIYLGSHLQKKLIPLFHYALKPGGFLFLGPSENLSTHRELFRPIHTKSRISQRLPTVVATRTILSGRSGTPSPIKPPNVASSTETDTYLLMQRIILDEFAPKAVVVDEEGQIVCASGNLEKYLTVSKGAFHNNVMRLAREGLKVGLRATLAEAFRKRREIINDTLTMRTKDGMQRVMIAVQPMPQMGDNSGLFIVVFHDVGLPVKEGTAHVPMSEDAGVLIEQLERELMTTREHLERSVQDLEAANEEMKSSNEELLSMNEELQSANEELETSKEEVQSANDNLSLVNTDLENLLASTQIATLFLDEDCHVRRITPSVGAIYNLFSSDTGRPLSHFTHKAKSMPPLPSMTETRRAARPVEHEVELTDGSWYLRRVLPYYTKENEIDGLAITFTDITERKRSELMVREKQQQLRLAITASRLGIWRWEPDTDFIILSDRGAEIFGMHTKENITREEMRDRFIRKDYRQAARDALAKAMDEKTDYVMEYPIIRPDGAELWVQAVGAGEYDAQGKLVGMHGVLKDVTDRKLAEERLVNSEKLYRAIGESINYGVWVCTPEGRNTYASDSFLELLGLTQEECSSFGWGEMLHPDDRQSTIAAWQECVRGGKEIWDREHRFKGKDGQWHPILARGIPVKNEKGEITSWVGINLDISRQKQAEASLRESEERFRKMADYAPVLIWISDSQKMRSWFNRPWLEFVGSTLEKQAGKGWLERVHPDDIERCWETYSFAFDARKPYKMEYRLKRKDGEFRWMLSSGMPMYDANNTFLGYVGSSVDITDHKQAVDALKEADRRKDEFLATLAHELRNPLAPLSNGLQVMRLAASTKPDLLQQMQDVMERQVVHMVRLVDDLLDVSRITRGLIELHNQRIDIRSAVNSALELSRPLIDAKRHTLSVSLPKKPLCVMGDPTRLSQIIANLLNNAAKYTPEQGKIALKVSSKGSEIELSIKDDGIGIPKEMLPKIFDVFVQVDTALERSQGGLGIGLTLVRKLVGLHGGTVDVMSEGMGKGSEFIIHLPIAPDA